MSASDNPMLCGRTSDIVVPPPVLVLIASQTTTNGSGNFVDQAQGLEVVNNGVTIDSSQSIIGGESFYFNGTTGFLQVLNHPDFNLALNSFTIEYYKRAQAKAGNKQNIDFRRAGLTGKNISVYRDTSGVEQFLSYNVNNSLGTHGNLTWDHYAISLRRNADNTSQWWFYKNGVAGVTSSVYVTGGGYEQADLTIGARYDGANTLLGHMDFIRIHNGHCLYPDGQSFTPPTTY